MNTARPSIDAVAERVCELAASACGRSISEVRPHMEWDREVFESLDEVDFILDCEAEFGVNLSNETLAAFERQRNSASPLLMQDFAQCIIGNWDNTIPSSTRPSICRNCRYDLKGLSRGPCPECGHINRRTWRESLPD